MRTPDLVEALELGVELERLGAEIARGQAPEPEEVVKMLSRVIVTFADIDELKPHLSEAARAREDYLIDQLARGQLGERPK